MKLTEADELNFYRLKVGLFARPSRETSSSFGNGVIIYPPSIVCYDGYKEEIGLHVFHCMSDVTEQLGQAHCVTIPQGFEDEMVEGPIEVEMEDGTKVTRSTCNCVHCKK